jgi:hypothetical protein
METNPMAVALIGVIGGIIICLLGLLITIVMGLKAEMTDRTKTLFGKVDEIQGRLSGMVLVSDYKTDCDKIDMKLDEHGSKILRLEFKIFNGVKA